MSDDVTPSTASDVVGGGTPPVEVGTAPPVEMDTAPPSAPSSPPPAITLPEKVFSDFIPEAFKNSESVKAALAAQNPSEYVFQRLSDLEASLSTMDRVPKDDATPEQIKAWVESVKPADLNAYGDLAPKLGEHHAHLQDMMNAAYSADVTNTIKNAAQEVGVQPWQLKHVMEKVNGSQLELADSIHKQALESEQTLNSDFDKLMTTHFGTERTKVQDIGKQFLADHVSADLQPYLRTLPNEALVLLASAAYNAHRKYGLEDTLPATTTHAVGNSKAEMDAAISEAMSTLQTMDQFSPQYQAQQAKIRQLCDASAKRFGV